MAKAPARSHRDDFDDEDDRGPRRRHRPVRRSSSFSATSLILILVGVALLAVVGGGAVALVMFRKDRKPAVAGTGGGDDKGDTRTASALEEAVAEIDRREPDGWRLKELEAKRKTYPREQNSALVVVAAAEKLPRDWPSEQFREIIDKQPVRAPFGLNEAEFLRSQLQRVNAVSSEARTKLAVLPGGRHEVAWSDKLHETELPHLLQVRRVCQLPTTACRSWWSGRITIRCRIRRAPTTTPAPSPR